MKRFIIRPPDVSQPFGLAITANPSNTGKNRCDQTHAADDLPQEPEKAAYGEFAHRGSPYFTGNNGVIGVCFSGFITLMYSSALCTAAGHLVHTPPTT